MNLIFEINGGVGKSIMATAVISCMKKKYPESKVIVVSEYPDVFVGNPEVDRVFRHGMLNFYEEYVRDKEVKIFRLEPYNTENYTLGKQHLIKSWCELYGLEYAGELPKLYLSDLEIRRAGITGKEVPIMVFQPFGGFVGTYSWNRDIPPLQAMEIVRKYKKNFEVIQLKRPDQVLIEGCGTFQGGLREAFALLAVSDKRILIDSFAQHAAAALDLPSTVLWITNKPEVFGYEMHTNIKARPFDKKINAVDSYLEEFTFTGEKIYQYPYNDNKVFNLDFV